MINPVSHNTQLSFGAKLNSPRLRFCQKDFYIKIPGYGRNANWAKTIIETADEAVNWINRGWSFENVIKRISIGVTKANKFTSDKSKKEHSGILRTPREGWNFESSWSGFSLITDYDKKHGNKRYTHYEKKLDEIIKTPLKEIYKDVSLTVPKQEPASTRKTLYHGSKDKINGTFRLLDKLYSFLTKKYLNKPLNDKDLEVINNCIAQMRWILAHSTPWERGSDSISNVFMKSLYKALNIKTYPPAKGISFDMEAYCTNLADYKKNFQNYFEKPPEIIKK